jgi:hypothetical protein
VDGAGTVLRTSAATGFEAAARTVFVATAGTVTEAEALTAFSDFTAFVVCELATIAEGGAGIVTATGAETVAEMKRGSGALVCLIREPAGSSAEGAEVVGAAAIGIAADARTVPGMLAITSSGAGIETVAGAFLVSSSGNTGRSRDFRCAIIAASIRLLRRIRAIRARCILHHAREWRR